LQEKEIATKKRRNHKISKTETFVIFVLLCGYFFSTEEVPQGRKSPDSNSHFGS
jgi:hypothetical protein